MSKTRGFVRGLLRFTMRTVLLLVVPGIAIAVGLYFYAESGRYVVTENAYVKANVVAVSADVSGRVEWVGVNDNELVNKGQILFRLDQEPFRLALQKADAQLSLVATEVEFLRADYHESIAETGEAEERIRFLTRQLERQRKLREKKLGSEESYDEAAHQLETARQRLKVLRQRVQRTLVRLSGDPNVPVEKHPQHLRAKAERDQAAVDLADTIISAPSAGIVSNMKLQIGEYVEEGDAIFSLIETDRIWVEANLKETQLTHVREGQVATVVVDAYPDVEWVATVDAIAPATGAEFSVLPPQNATGNWVKVVQRVPVELDIQRAPDSPVLRAGMTVSVSIDTERDRKLPANLQGFVGSDDFLEMVRQYGRGILAKVGIGSAASSRSADAGA